MLKSPTGIGQNLLIVRIQVMDQRGEGRLHERKEGSRASSTEIGEGPHACPDHRELLPFGAFGKGDNSACGEHSITQFHTITGNVSEGPDGPFFDFVVWGEKEFGKGSDSSCIGHITSLSRGSRGNVDEDPGSFEAEFWMGSRVADVVDQLGDNPTINNFLDGGPMFCGEHDTNLNCGFELVLLGSVENGLGEGSKGRGGLSRGGGCPRRGPTSERLLHITCNVEGDGGIRVSSKVTSFSVVFFSSALANADDFIFSLFSSSSRVDTLFERFATKFQSLHVLVSRCFFQLGEFSQ